MSTILVLGLLPVQMVMAKIPDNGLETQGLIFVAGAMTESPCMLGMVSDFQEVDLGPLSNANLQKPGDQGAPVEFTFNLRYCFVSGSHLTKSGNGVASSSMNFPVMYTEFVSAMDPGSQNLIQVRGIKGIGLRLKDAEGHPIRLGQLNPPQFLHRGPNIVKYTAVVERTSDNLIPGPFQATVDFKIHYY